MKNITINAYSESYMTVTADTERFGRNEIMFEGNTFNQCFDYIKRETGKGRLQLASMAIFAPVTDRDGRTFPCYMEVCN